MGKRWLQDVIGICFGLFAYCLTYTAGSRGFYPFDQSIVFDGSYRILSGQIPYKDFVMPFGPVTFVLHALYFKLLGVSYHSYLVGSASIAFLATVISILTVRSLFAGNLLALIAAGLITSVWFYAPFGTPWVDQTGFFFSLVAISFAIHALKCQSRLSSILSALSGLFWLTAFLSKQNIGAFIFFLFPILFLATKGKQGFRSLLLFGLGALIGAVTFLIWLKKESDFESFVRWFILLPGELGKERLSSLPGIGFGLVRPYFDGRGAVSMNTITLLCLVSGIVGARFTRSIPSLGRDRKQTLIASSIISIYIPFFQHIFINTTLNQADNGFALLGTCFGITIGFLQTLGEGFASTGRKVSSGSLWAILSFESWKRRLVFVTLIVALLASSTVAGIKVSMERKVHDIFNGARFEDEIAIENLKPLRWAKPTAMGGYEITEESVVALYRYLSQSRSRFFIFPDFTIFYGLLGKPSPQPLLWFHEGVTFSAKENRWLDRRIRESLEKAQVEIFVLEQLSWFNTGKRLDRFPETKAYLFSSFTPVERIGTFIVYRKRHSSPLK